MNRFWDKVAKTKTCWLWTGGQSEGGYGYFYYENKNMRAHRVSVILSGRKIPKGMFVDHKCRVRNCVRPAHLRVVTPRVNALENTQNVCAFNKLKTHCSKGHPLSGSNLRTRSRQGWIERQCRKCRVFYNKAWRKKVRERMTMKERAL